MAAAPKRSLFNKPKWATTPAASSSTESEFYRHSDRVYKDILAENERRRQEELNNKSKTEHDSDDHLRDPKRRRISQENEDGTRINSDDEDTGDDISDFDKTSARSLKDSQYHKNTRSKGPVDPPIEASSDGSSPRGRRKASSPQTTIIDLDDGAAEIDSTSNRSPPKPKTRVVEELSDDSESDEYVRELKRKAREKRKQQLLDRAQSTTPDISRPSSSNLQAPQQPSNQQGTSTTHPPPADDPICKILITSRIPGTTPLIIERRASQRLQEVRQYWCQRQGFSPEFSRKVFLTWRLHRLYDISTCKSLSDKADRHSQKSAARSFGSGKGDDDDDDDNLLFSPPGSQPQTSSSSSDPSSTSFLEKSKGQIAVEAMTEELLQEAKKDALAGADRNHQPQQSSSVALSFHPADSDTIAHHPTAGSASAPANTDTSGQPGPSKEPDIRLLLRAPRFEPLKLKVRPSTPVWKVVAAFKDQRIKPALAAAGGKRDLQQVQVTLTFDGDSLAPDSAMGETGIEDTDAVDVVVKM